MDKLNRNFVRGNVLKAEELNELVAKLNEFAKCVNDNSLETNKTTMQSIRRTLEEVRKGQIVIGTTLGTAYDGASGAELEETVRELVNVTVPSKMMLVFVSPSVAVIAYGQGCTIRYRFSSTIDDEDTGPGTVKCTLNGRVVSSENIEQGENSFDVGRYLSIGDNTLAVHVTDAYGNTRKLTYTINTVTVSITSTFDDTKAYKEDITFPYTPIGAISKTIHFKVDGVEIGTEETTVNNRQLTYSIPAKKHGVHSLEVYIVSIRPRTSLSML